MPVRCRRRLLSVRTSRRPSRPIFVRLSYVLPFRRVRPVVTVDVLCLSSRPVVRHAVVVRPLFVLPLSVRPLPVRPVVCPVVVVRSESPESNICIYIYI